MAVMDEQGQIQIHTENIFPIIKKAVYSGHEVFLRELVSNGVDACPVACIDQGKGKNKKGTDFYWINFDTCIDCGICLQVCPVEGAIVAEERPDLQKTP